MLLFDTGKKLEKAVGEEAAQIIMETLEAMNENVRKESVTKEHLDMRLKELELRLLKWQLGIGFATIVIMAKGFGWLGF